MLDRLTLKDMFDERLSLLTMETLELAQQGHIQPYELKQRLKTSDLPLRIKDQYFMKVGKTLLTPVGLFTVRVLDEHLRKRSFSMSPKEDPPDVFRFAYSLCSWVNTHVEAPSGYFDVTLKDCWEQWSDKRLMFNCEVMC